MAEALDRSNCGVARPRGKEAAVKPVSRRTEVPYQADGAGKLAPHSKIRCSPPEVNGPVAQGKFTSRLREVRSPGWFWARSAQGARAESAVPTRFTVDNRVGQETESEFQDEERHAAGLAVPRDGRWRGCRS